MGYELKLIIGQERIYDDTFGGKFNRSISIIAEVDLSNPGYKSGIYKLVMEAQEAEKQRLEGNPDLRRLVIETPYYIEDMNSYAKVVEDTVGLPLVSLPLDVVYDVLYADWENSKADYKSLFGYRRFYLAKVLIQAIKETFVIYEVNDEVKAVNPLAGQLVVIPWGY